MSLFDFDWDSTVTEEEKERLLNNIADQVVRRGIAVPAQWLLEAHRPVMNIAGQMAITMAPMLAGLLPGGAYAVQKYTKLMQDRANVDYLIDLIEIKNQEIALAAR